MTSRIRAVISKKKLTLIPGMAFEPTGASGVGDNEFDVIVTNESDKFASFQLELLAPGLDPDSELEWYTVEPEICAKKPPGAETQFRVAIIKPPIPAYETTIELTLRIFSVEFAHLFTSQTLHLTIEKPRKSLRVYLPTKVLKAFPGDQVEIPVLVYNLSPNSSEVTLDCSLPHLNWLAQGATQTLMLEPGDSEKTSFWCQLPKHFSTFSQPYPFTIEATSHTSRYSAREQGVLEVLPQGVVELSCDVTRQTIPTKRELRNQRQGVATYGLQFTNDSNLAQQVDLEFTKLDHHRCEFEISNSLKLDPGDSQPLLLGAKTRRPWLGLKQRLSFEVTPTLISTHPREGSDAIRAHPTSKTLELEVLPLIAPWLQLGSALLALLLLWLLWILRPVGHQSTVNFVRFSGDGTTVLSGSSDQTVLRWFTNKAIWQPDRMLRLQFNALRLNAPENIGQKIGKAVRVARHGEKNNLVAVGLEDGTIQLWDVAFTMPQKTLYQGTDRVFDLAFTKDSHYLFSGHGSGNVRLWNLVLEKPPTQPNSRQIRTAIAELYPLEIPKRAYFSFSVSALAISEQPKLAIVAGQYNKLALWDWNHNQIYEVPYHWQKSSDRFNHAVMSRYQSIVSLTTTDKLLATADNRGYITLWDLAKRQCQTNLVKTHLQTPGQPGICQVPILDQWQDGHGGKPVRSVALSANGCYLASAGDDGRVMLWSLQHGKRHRHTGIGPSERLLGQFPTRLNSVDITQKDNTLFVTSDADQDRVMLYRIHQEKTDDSCK
jgi:WD40 repeat protein